MTPSQGLPLAKQALICPTVDGHSKLNHVGRFSTWSYDGNNTGRVIYLIQDVERGWVSPYAVAMRTAHMGGFAIDTSAARRIPMSMRFLGTFAGSWQPILSLSTATHGLGGLAP